MSRRHLLERAWTAFRLRRLRKQGLTLPDDCRLSGMPSFGSEPYLITIGHHVAMSARVAFITHDGGTRVFREQDPYKNVIKYGRITVLDNCVIGFGAIILPGVVIGPNSVVSAGSVVTRNVPPNVIVAGNPAVPVMTIEAYAKWAAAASPQYDEEEYRRDKRAALLKMRLRGGAPNTRAAPPASGAHPAQAAGDKEDRPHTARSTDASVSSGSSTADAATCLPGKAPA